MLPVRALTCYSRLQPRGIFRVHWHYQHTDLMLVTASAGIRIGNRGGGSLIPDSSRMGIGPGSSGPGRGRRAGVFPGLPVATTSDYKAAGVTVLTRRLRGLLHLGARFARRWHCHC